MDWIVLTMSALKPWIPTLAVLAALMAALFFVNRALEKQYAQSSDTRFRQQVIMILLTAAGVLTLIVVFPIGDTLRGQLLGFLGIVLSATIALSSTTFMGNAFAGIMLRTVGSMRAGDFIKIGDQFGRVSDRGLFHTEIQTEDRDLTTMPNLHLVTHPFTVVRSSGTIISAQVSLGYDVPRLKVEEYLTKAASSAGLTDPFAQVLDLQDHAVVYRVGGLLEEVKQMLSTRSQLRKCILDALHQRSIEIVSPSFMNTRAVDPRKPFIPPVEASVSAQKEEVRHEDLAFDKAEQAEATEKTQEEKEKVEGEIDSLLEQLGDEKDELKKQLLEKEIADRKVRVELIKSRLAAAKEESSQDPVAE